MRQVKYINFESQTTLVYEKIFGKFVSNIQLKPISTMYQDFINKGIPKISQKLYQYSSSALNL